MKERSLYEKLKSYYEILELDENVTEEKLKKAYRFAAKKYHPDSNPNNPEAESKFKLVSEAYTILKDESNRRIFAELKKKYDREEKTNYSEQTYQQEWRRREKNNSEDAVKETTNKYILTRKDGSKIEIQPLNKYYIEDQFIYSYRIIQYGKDMTLINKVYGRINLDELLRNPEYADFCANSFLSAENIHRSAVHYNGFIGHVEAACKNGRTYYRGSDVDNDEFDISIEVGNIDVDVGNDDTISTLDYDIWIEKVGSGIIKGRPINQYLAFSDVIGIMDLIYSEDISFIEMKRNKKYKNAIAKKLLTERRIKQKIDAGGYVGQLQYNPKRDDYDVVVDKELEKVLNVKQNREDR